MPEINQARGFFLRNHLATAAGLKGGECKLSSYCRPRATRAAALPGLPGHRVKLRRSSPEGNEGPQNRGRESGPPLAVSLQIETRAQATPEAYPDGQSGPVPAGQNLQEMMGAPKLCHLLQKSLF